MREENTQRIQSSSFIPHFENIVSSVLKNHLNDNSPLLAAVSGGADSMAMLASLINLSLPGCLAKSSQCSVPYGLFPKDRLFCLHVEHGLRPAAESEGDAVFVKNFCEKHGVKCRVVSIPQGEIAGFARQKGCGIEAAARYFRRKALLKEAALLGGETLILTAHTKDDLLETVLMRFLRGCGPAGLAAMPARKGNFLRPLLSVSRADVTGYLRERKIPWREDSSNKDEKFLRNKIRNILIPQLNEQYPSWKKAVSALANTQSFAVEFISEEAEKRIRWEERKRKREKGEGRSGQLAVSSEQEVNWLVTDAGNFFVQPQIIREEALFQGVDLIAKNSGSVPKRAVIRKFCAGEVAAVDLGFVRVRRKKGLIILEKVPKEAACY